MDVGKRSHVTEPYYVEIKEVGKDYIITNIPEEHSLKISEEVGNWEYQTSRMTLVGTGNSFKNYLFNQSLK